MELGKVKSLIDKFSKEKAIDVQVAWDTFFFEEFLYRLSKSEYSKSFVFKRGFYLQSIVGIDVRSTMDLDLKLMSSTLPDEQLNQIIQDICSIHSDSKIDFKVMNISNIKAKTKYEGRTIKIEGKFYNVRKVFSVDIGFGDVVTPYSILYNYKSLLLDDEYKLYAYPIETIIAEKLETLVSKETNNSRVKDLIDLYLLNNYGFDEDLMTASVINTFHLRQTLFDKDYIKDTINEVLTYGRIQDLFDNYIKTHAFAKKISFDECIHAVWNIFNRIHFKERLDISRYQAEIHLIRHGEDEQDKIGGWSNNRLTSKGIEEVNDLINVIDNHYDLFVSSSLERAKETAEILNSKLKSNIIYDNCFKEINNGDLANLTKKDFMKQYPGLYFSSLGIDDHYPNGESPREFYIRIRDAFLKLLEENQGKKILLVTHGGVITIILAMINGYEYSTKLKITPKTASLTILK